MQTMQPVDGSRRTFGQALERQADCGMSSPAASEAPPHVVHGALPAGPVSETSGFRQKLAMTVVGGSMRSAVTPAKKSSMPPRKKTVRKHSDSHHSGICARRCQKVVGGGAIVQSLGRRKSTYLRARAAGRVGRQ